MINDSFFWNRICLGQIQNSRNYSSEKRRPYLQNCQNIRSSSVYKSMSKKCPVKNAISKKYRKNCGQLLKLKLFFMITDMISWILKSETSPYSFNHIISKILSKSKKNFVYNWVFTIKIHNPFFCLERFLLTQIC